MDEIVEAGQIDPDHVHVPGVYIDRIYKADPNSPFSEKRIEKLTVQGGSETKMSKGQEARLKIVRRAAK